MMRKIKFRGWLTKRKKMFSAETMAKDQLTLLTTGQFINVHGGSTKLSVIYPLGEFIPMQYAGLDKNNNEIYEGDIIKGPSDSATVLGPNAKQNKRTYPRFLVKWMDDFNWGGFCLMLLEQDRTIFQRTLPFLKDSEVIGNIYENPELLNEFFERGIAQWNVGTS